VKRTRILVVSTIIVLALGSSIYGLRLTFPNDKPVGRQDRWPDGLAELASSQTRVRSYGTTSGAPTTTPATSRRSTRFSASTRS
jgi:hypothetical protein